MSADSRVKKYQIDFIDNLPYQLGTTFDENCIGLELQKDFDDQKFYSSTKYSEVFLFGNFYESVCNLWFTKDILSGIGYRFENKYFELFKEGINNELPDEYKLEDNPLIMGNPPSTYIGNRIILLESLNEKFFFLTISLHPRMDPIKTLMEPIVKIKQKKLLEQQVQYSGSKFEKYNDEVLERFSHYFSRLDIKGIQSILSGDIGFNEEWIEESCLEMIEGVFDNLNSEGVTSLKAYPGVCSGCSTYKNIEYKGFTFIDERSGGFFDIIIDYDDKEVTFIQECLGLRNENNHLNKEERRFIFPLLSCRFGWKE